jgi:hypothetical protein
MRKDYEPLTKEAMETIWMYHDYLLEIHRYPMVMTLLGGCHAVHVRLWMSSTLSSFEAKNSCGHRLKL